jgi:glycerate kinase
MTFLLAPDSFKESMTAKEACEAMERGIKKVFQNAKCIHVPMADGGEGTMQALVDATGGKVYKTIVKGPLGNEVEASYGILGDGKTAVLEMASASGIHLVSREQRNPLITSTYGTGQLIKAALSHSIKKMIIGIGGSATNDGGAGMAQALGAKFLDKSGNEIKPGGGELHKIEKIDTSHLSFLTYNIEIEVACDVTNPLIGEKGASNVFGRQKGATEEMVRQLDANLKHYAEKIKEALGKDIAMAEGAGAAGGMGAGLMAFTNAKLSKGIELVIKYANLDSKMKEADYVFTGEGSIDNQTQYGKTPFGVAQTAKKYNKPVIAFAGKVGDVDELYTKGIDSIFSILNSVCSLDEALTNGKINLELATERVARFMKIGLNMKN